MCLGIPGQIVAITNAERQAAMADISGVRREVNVACILEASGTEALIGRWALIHAGFAMALIDAGEAARTLDALRQLGETEEALAAMTDSDRALEAAR